MTSSPAPTPSASRTSTIASVPFATPTVCRTPRNSAASRSNPSTSGPKMKRPDSSVRAKASCSSGISGAYCALTSTCGIGGTASHGNRPAPPHNPVPPAQHDRDDDRELGVLERVVEAFPARAEGPADAGEAEAPDRAARRREQRVTAEGRAEDAGRDRDERADAGRQASDKRGGVAPALEPLLRPV